MDKISKEALAFTLAVIAVLVAMAIFYLAGLDTEMMKLRAGAKPSTSS